MYTLHACMLSCFSHVQLFAILWTVACQASLSMAFSRQENWSGLSCPPPGDLPNLGVEPVSLKSPALAGRFFTIRVTWEALRFPLEHHSLQLETVRRAKTMTEVLTPSTSPFFWPESNFEHNTIACPWPFRGLGWLLAMCYGCQVGQFSRWSSYLSLALRKLSELL